MNHKRFVKIESTYTILTKFWGKKDCDFCYIPIFKNAHSWGKYYFELTCDFKETEDFLNKKYIIFLRDPTERWCSGVAQWISNHLPEGTLDYTIDPITMRIIFKAIDLDGHTEPQTTFIKGLDINNNDLYLFHIDDPDFEKKLKLFSAKYLKARFPKTPINPRNTMEQSPLKTSIVKQLKLAMHIEPTYKNRIINYYQHDYLLLKKSQFYE